MNRRPIRLSILLFLVVACTLPARAQETTPDTSRSEQRWGADIRAFEAADREQAPPEGAVLFVGSSSIRMWKTLAEDFPGVSVLNRGFGGSEIEDAIYFADRIILPYRPRTVVVYAGDNDLWAGETPEQVFEDFRYVDEVVTDDRVVLIFRARVGDREVQGLDHLVVDAEGRITEFTVMVRPLSGLIALATAMGERLEADPVPTP